MTILRNALSIPNPDYVRLLRRAREREHRLRQRLRRKEIRDKKLAKYAKQEEKAEADAYAASKFTISWFASSAQPIKPDAKAGNAAAGAELATTEASNGVVEGLAEASKVEREASTQHANEPQNIVKNEQQDATEADNAGDVQSQPQAEALASPASPPPVASPNSHTKDGNNSNTPAAILARLQAKNAKKRKKLEDEDRLDEEEAREDAIAEAADSRLRATLQPFTRILPESFLELVWEYWGYSESIVTSGGGTGAGVASQNLELLELRSGRTVDLVAAPVGRSKHALVYSQGEILALTGQVRGGLLLRTVDTFSLRTFRWTTTCTLEPARVNAAVTWNSSRSILYIVGGSDGFKALSDVIAFEVRTRRWHRLPNLPSARRNHAAALLNGCLYVVGGVNAAERELATVDVLDLKDPKNLTWKSLAPMSKSRASLALIAANGKLFAIGGHDRATSHASTEIYCPTFNKWIPGPSLTEPRSGAAAVYLPGLHSIIVTGGLGGEQYLSSIEVLSLPAEPGVDVFPRVLLPPSAQAQAQAKSQAQATLDATAVQADGDVSGESKQKPTVDQRSAIALSKVFPPGAKLLPTRASESAIANAEDAIRQREKEEKMRNALRAASGANDYSALNLRMCGGGWYVEDDGDAFARPDESAVKNQAEDQAAAREFLMPKDAGVVNENATAITNPDASTGSDGSEPKERVKCVTLNDISILYGIRNPNGVYYRSGGDYALISRREPADPAFSHGIDQWQHQFDPDASPSGLLACYPQALAVTVAQARTQSIRMLETWYAKEESRFYAQREQQHKSHAESNPSLPVDAIVSDASESEDEDDDDGYLFDPLASVDSPAQWLSLLPNWHDIAAEFMNETEVRALYSACEWRRMAGSGFELRRRVSGHASDVVPYSATELLQFLESSDQARKRDAEEIERKRQAARLRRREKIMSSQHDMDELNGTFPEVDDDDDDDDGDEEDDDLTELDPEIAELYGLARKHEEVGATNGAPVSSGETNDTHTTPTTDAQAISEAQLLQDLDSSTADETSPQLRRVATPHLRSKPTSDGPMSLGDEEEEEKEEDMYDRNPRAHAEAGPASQEGTVVSAFNPAKLGAESGETSQNSRSNSRLPFLLDNATVDEDSEEDLHDTVPALMSRPRGGGSGSGSGVSSPSSPQSPPAPTDTVPSSSPASTPNIRKSNTTNTNSASSSHEYPFDPLPSQHQSYRQSTPPGSVASSPHGPRVSPTNVPRLSHAALAQAHAQSIMARNQASSFVQITSTPDGLENIIGVSGAISTTGLDAAISFAADGTAFATGFSSSVSNSSLPVGSIFAPGVLTEPSSLSTPSQGGETQRPMPGRISRTSTQRK